MALSGEVVLRKGHFVDHSDMKKTEDILTIGKFTAAYRSDEEAGFLRYSEGSHQFFALSAPPSWSIRRNLKKYMYGKTDDVSLDFSGGAALRQITRKLTLIDQIKNGGPIVWPIIAIGLFALTGGWKMPKACGAYYSYRALCLYHSHREDYFSQPCSRKHRLCDGESQ